MKQLHDDFRATTMASSSNAILATLNDLYQKMAIFTQDGVDANTVTIARAVQSNILGAVESAATGSNITIFKKDDETGKITWNDGINAGYKELPSAYSLPDGAVAIKYENNEFTIATTLGGALNIQSITYPASLWYTACTPIRTSGVNNTFVWPTTISDWNEGDKFNGWGTEVETGTKKIALQNSLNYGVACLESTIKAATPLKDKEDNDVSHTDIKLTGVLVGGQPSKIGWDFKPTSDAQMSKTIYDKLSTAYGLPTTSFDPACYTLVLDNYKTTEQEQTVNVALEFEYSASAAEAFIGANGKILPGTKFYLVGQLSIDATSGNATSPNPDPAIAGGNRIFAQDYKTVANFTISSLKHAYNTIPDLRATLLQLGLSVNLAWETGYTFNVVFN